MELFDKIYGCYYSILRKILKEASETPLSRKELERITEKQGFQESALTIVPNLVQGIWPFLCREEDGRYKTLFPLNTCCPLTGLQKSWLRALMEDERMPLFLEDEEREALRKELADTPSLYEETDFHYFDRFYDKDAFGDPTYRQYFQNILKALDGHRVLVIAYEGKNGTLRTFEIAPCQLQYSPKDDKFRLCGLEYYRGNFRRSITLNLGKLLDCHVSDRQFSVEAQHIRFKPVKRAERPVVFEISGERNSLERCMLHFASYEKHTEYDEDRECFVCSVWYDPADETELLIDILSFGPVIKVLGPEDFLRQIRERVKNQHERFYKKI